MTLRSKRILALSLGSLVSACTGGNFCDVVPGPILFPDQVATVVVQGARAEAVNLDVQNQYGAKHCGW